MLLGCLLFSACAFTYSGFLYQEASAFTDDHHEVEGVVVASDCRAWCKGGPDVDVAYQRIDGKSAVGRLAYVPVHYRVGTKVSVVYSDGSAAEGTLSLPSEVGGFARGALGFRVAGSIGLILAFAAWAFPANLRRLDRLDAARAAGQTGPVPPPR